MRSDALDSFWRTIDAARASDLDPAEALTRRTWLGPPPRRCWNGAINCWNCSSCSLGDRGVPGCGRTASLGQACDAILQGRSYFERVLALSPEEDDDSGDGEPLLYVAGEAFEELTGSELPEPNPVSWKPGWPAADQTATSTGPSEALLEVQFVFSSDDGAEAASLALFDVEVQAASDWPGTWPSVAELRRVGIDHINIDVMYGNQNLFPPTDLKWKRRRGKVRKVAWVTVEEWRAFGATDRERAECVFGDLLQVAIRSA